MKIAIPKERRPGEKRVAATPETVKKFKSLGFDVVVEADAGLAADFLDAGYVEAGATIAPDAKSALADADLVLRVRAPMTASDGGSDEVGLMKKGAILVAGLNALTSRYTVKAIANAGLSAFAMELMPRITRAQSMDILSSQSNLAGYRAVIESASAFGRAFPMMMTAAGTVAPARVFVMGVGVAGLQAIATAKRLGAVVSATDVRPATKEQVESLGGKFVWVDDEEARQSQTSGGYAKEMSDDYKRKQAALIAETVKKQDIIITTALIPGRKAPTLVTADMVKSMKQGSVIIDLAAEMGGNCELTKPGETSVQHGVRIVGLVNVPSLTPVDASALFAKNLLNFLTPQVDKETKAIKFNWEDETVTGTCVVRDGTIVHPALKEGN